MSDEVKQEERVICKHCGEEVLYIAESEVWIHARGKNLGFTNCCGIHNPYKGIINPGPFAEPAAPSETKPAQQTASVVELPKIALTEEDGKAEEDRQKNWGVITGRDEKGYCEF